MCLSGAGSVSKTARAFPVIGSFKPISWFRNFCRRMSGRAADLKEYRKRLSRIIHHDFSINSDSELAEHARRIGRELQNKGSCPDSRNGGGPESPGRDTEAPDPSVRAALEEELFALICEASRRRLGLDPFESQILAGLAMADGCLAELPTGEGKTLAAVFPACLHALSGQGVHILTFNDYLAGRDAEWMGPIYAAFGLSVGCVQEGMTAARKRAAYGCDITYASAKEAGFDFLRDQIAYDGGTLVHSRFDFVLVDEADSILVDEARIPLVIAGNESSVSWNADKIIETITALDPVGDYETDAEHRNIYLTDTGIEHIEQLLECGSLFDDGNRTLLETLYCGLHARALLQRDVDYIVRDSRIEIVDEYTGRVVDKRHWPDGIQAAVEAKEGLSRKTEGRILGLITLQYFLRNYSKLSGMTATALSAADELREFYGLEVIEIPPHKPSIRVDNPDIIFTHREAKRRAIVQEICKVHSQGRPILVGTGSVRESEELAADLRATGIRFSVLNAKNDAYEAGILANAGRFGAVTISTNMAGRGVDIRLGGQDGKERDAVTALGGLYVIGTNRHESVRIDRQLRGRAGRQGDPGITRFFISVEDDLFEHYGLTEKIFLKHRPADPDQPVSSRAIRFDIAHAQRVIEGQNFDIRRSLDRFSSLTDLQRRIVQSYRRWILQGGGSLPDGTCIPNTDSAAGSEEDAMLYESDPGEKHYGEKGLRLFGPEKLAELQRRVTLYHLDSLWCDHLAWIQDTRESIHLVNLGGREPFDEFRKQATGEFLRMQQSLQKAVDEEMNAIVDRNGSVETEMERLNGPSSTWTYQVNENQFGNEYELLKGRNIGFAAIAANPITSPFLLFWLFLKRFRKK